MRRFTAYRLCSLLLLGALLFPAPDALAAWPFRKKAAPAEDKKETPKPTPYQKFLKKKGLKSVTGTMKLYTDGKDVWLEVPDSLTGRKVLLSTVLRDSSDAALPAVPASVPSAAGSAAAFPADSGAAAGTGQHPASDGGRTDGSCQRRSDPVRIGRASDR